MRCADNPISDLQLSECWNNGYRLSNHPLRKAGKPADDLLQTLHDDFRSAIREDGTAIDPAGTAAACQPDPDAVIDPVGTATGATHDYNLL